MNISPSFEVFMGHKLFNHYYEKESLVYEYDPEKKHSIFHDQLLGEIMSTLGVKIPYSISNDQSSPFYERRSVKLEDPDFYSAFRDIYHRYEMDKKVYIWQDT
ncbi:MAG: hypothetical protein H0V82_05885 [Candidatus Protochlamydia sp.]|nr:hypothetical protein [Candidatus Protochlamydia sp.]